MQVYKCTRQINLVQLWAFILLYTSTNQNAQGLRLEIKRIEMYSYIYVVRIYDLLLACQHTATQRKDVEKSMYKIEQLKRLAYSRRNIHSRGVDCFDFIILKLLSTNYMYCKILSRDICHHATLRSMSQTCKAQKKLLCLSNYVLQKLACSSTRRVGTLFPLFRTRRGNYTVSLRCRRGCASPVSKEWSSLERDTYRLPASLSHSSVSIENFSFVKLYRFSITIQWLALIWDSIIKMYKDCLESIKDIIINMYVIK